MSLGWYIRRLANMSPPELVHRVKEQVLRRLARKRCYGWAAFAAPGALRPIPGLAEQLRQSDPAFRAALSASVEKLLAGHFTAHGVDWPQRAPDDLFPASLWRLDPVTGKFWPGTGIYCFDIKYRHERELGDVKFVWDLNRLQFLQPLAAAACLDPSDPRPLAAIERAIESWAEANPPFEGLGWNSGIELALRLVTLVLVASLCAGRLSKDTETRIAQIVAAHVYWLRRYPSLFSSANNHLMAEAMAEFVGALALPDLPGAGRIAAHAKAVLEREAGLQIFADGIGAEQSPTYGAFSAEMLVVADLAGSPFGQPLAGVVRARLEAFARGIATFADSNGLVPAIGDDDEGRVLSLCDAHETHYPASVARMIAGHFGFAPQLAAPPVPTELRDALCPAARAVEPIAEGLHTFASGGYSVLREQRAGHRLRLTLDHGPLGYLSIAAHGHADANAITLALDDEDLLVDPGTYLYHSGGIWRDWFRGTRAHNTLALAGQDQSLIAGPFNWSHKAMGQLDAATPGENWRLAARHDGYVKRFGVWHVRDLAATALGMAITDRLLPAPGDEIAEVVFQAAPGLAWRIDGNSAQLLRGDARRLSLTFSASGDIAVHAGGESVEDGWVSPRFGEKQPAQRLVWRGKIPAEGLVTQVNWG